MAKFKEKDKVRVNAPISALHNKTFIIKSILDNDRVVIEFINTIVNGVDEVTTLIIDPDNLELVI